MYPNSLMAFNDYLLYSNQFGVGQRIPRAAGDTENVISHVNKSVEYMKRVWREKDFSRVRHKCRNQHEVCS